MINSYKYSSLIKLQELVNNKVITEEDKSKFEEYQDMIIVNNTNTFLYDDRITIDFLTEDSYFAQNEYKVYSKTKTPYVKIKDRKIYLNALEHISDEYCTTSTSGINRDLEWKSYNIGLQTKFRL